MPFYPQMKKITINNYEQYMADYLDGTLSGTKQRELEAFLSQNPQLDEWLPDEILYLEPDKTITFAHKEQLLADVMQKRETSPLLNAEKPAHPIGIGRKWQKTAASIALFALLLSGLLVWQRQQQQNNISQQIADTNVPATEDISSGKLSSEPTQIIDKNISGKIPAMPTYAPQNDNILNTHTQNLATTRDIQPTIRAQKKTKNSVNVHKKHKFNAADLPKTELTELNNNFLGQNTSLKSPIATASIQAVPTIRIGQETSPNIVIVPPSITSKTTNSNIEAVQNMPKQPILAQLPYLPPPTDIEYETTYIREPIFIKIAENIPAHGNKPFSVKETAQKLGIQLLTKLEQKAIENNTWTTIQDGLLPEAYHTTQR